MVKGRNTNTRSCSSILVFVRSFPPLFPSKTTIDGGERVDYDALTFSYVEPTRSNAFPPELDFDTTVFTTKSDEIILAALSLVKKLKQLHYYTDAATFTFVPPHSSCDSIRLLKLVDSYRLKCEICQEAIVGEKEARAHAQGTSHQSFGEYDG